METAIKQTREERAEEIINGERPVVKTSEGYRVPSQRNPGRYYLVSKKNGKIECDCPDHTLHSNGQNGESESPENGRGKVMYCKHILSVFRAVKRGAVSLEKSPTAAILEYPFAPSQILKKGNLDYVEGAAITQRMNDALGFENWSFSICDVKQVEEEIIVRGRLTIYANGRKIIKEQFGGATFTRTRDGGEIVSRADTTKAAATDCVKKCATLCGVGLHLYSEGNRYQSFTSV